MARGLLGAVALGGLGLLAVLGTRARGEASATREPDPARALDSCTRSTGDQAHTCARCHAAIHHEWRSSGHAEAFESVVFRAEHDPAPSSFCADCHAAGRARYGHQAHDGVDCASCHAPATEATSTDATSTDATAKGVQICAACHQFQFPAGELGTHGVYDPADPLQDTVHEWQRSDAARDGIDCIDCHMPSVDEGPARHRDHRLVGAGDPELVGSSIVASAVARPSPAGLEVTVTLAPGDVGHRVPTGDMFRQLRVAAWIDGSPPVEAWLSRAFAQLPASDDRGFRLRPIFDDRVPAPGDGEPVEVKLLLPGAPPGVLQPRARWSVELHRMPPVQAHERGLDPTTLRTLVAEGTLP